ncbi:DUF968 domain-containing protein [Bradyrhizobium lablabi]|uniref:DUF968 domain-containing protein n=1 Tax=Bradyrhizobium lablabi TaxID=722472 RepID=UPI001BA91CCC|nr:DUF968 domain-containing protein [Bradyrhizobium lablabi]
MTAQRIIRPATAFSVASTKQKRPRERDNNHLAFIRSLRCCICGAPGPDPAHIRSANPVYGKRETGGGEKASDKWTVPLCRAHHNEQHAYCKAPTTHFDPITAELRWWASMGIDPFGLALSLYAATGDDEIADGILRANMRTA